jgi:hypothetical protein
MDSVVAKFATTAVDGKVYQVEYYNLDVIISVGYRVKSQQGIHFRQWATHILKEYILKGYAVHQRFERLENRVTDTERKIDFFVKTSLPPQEGIFFDGQIFDAYSFVSDLIKSAKRTIVLRAKWRRNEVNPYFPKAPLVAGIAPTKNCAYSIICFAIFINNRISVGLRGGNNLRY